MCHFGSFHDFPGETAVVAIPDNSLEKRMAKWLRHIFYNGQPIGSLWQWCWLFCCAFAARIQAPAGLTKVVSYTGEWNFGNNTPFCRGPRDLVKRRKKCLKNRTTKFLGALTLAKRVSSALLQLLGLGCTLVWFTAWHMETPLTVVTWATILYTLEKPTSSFISRDCPDRVDTAS